MCNVAVPPLGNSRLGCPVPPGVMFLETESDLVKSLLTTLPVAYRMKSEPLTVAPKGFWELSPLHCYNFFPSRLRSVLDDAVIPNLFLQPHAPPRFIPLYIGPRCDLCLTGLSLALSCRQITFQSLFKYQFLKRTSWIPCPAQAGLGSLKPQKVIRSGSTETHKAKSRKIKVGS